MRGQLSYLIVTNWSFIFFCIS